jgi:parvulin-like peptidyl-prolyl isomerase
MWNDVFVGGAPFDAVAKRKSTGFHASEGGLFDWTTQAALKSKVIDKALFENPVRGLSQILEDSDGFHFIEVLERKNAAVQSFQDSQVEIRKTLADAKAKKQKTDFIKKVRETTPVWTKWPSDIPGSKDLTEYLQ